MFGDVQKCIALIAAPDPVAAREEEERAAREGMARHRENKKENRSNVSAVEEQYEQEEDEGDQEQALEAMSDRGWLNRALMSAQYANYFPVATCPKTADGLEKRAFIEMSMLT